MNLYIRLFGDICRSCNNALLQDDIRVERGLSGGDDGDLTAADVNGDGNVDASVARKILRTGAKLEML